ncbi:unnamed protein product [Adineta steineri]|uniref:TGF-beta family profile domain-containing protein n=1 Tax=Adineta steineri TaxID=433720 RepID=A0A813MA30_9BILA|nr:unnamed protein product [Adineta steineri]CAF4065166.1 unnamed protein product [Adineta steineri]
MFTGLLLNLIKVPQHFPFKFFSKIPFLLFLLVIVYLFCSTHSASIPTSNNLSSSSTSNQFELMSNSSYRNFILRQYFIDLLNISHTSLVRSMIYNHHLASNSIKIKNRRRKRLNENISNSPIFTLQPTNCLMIDNQVQTTFTWSYSIELLSSIELIYHIDSQEIKQLITIPLHLKFKHSQTLLELFTINTYLQFDSNRDFYSINLFEYIVQIKNENFLIESIINNETCQTSHTYMIISSTSTNLQLKPNQTLKLNPTLSFDLRQLTKTQTDLSSSSMCKVKTIQIKFEDLGLAYLIIRPKEYTFTYCDGSCSHTILQQQQSQSSIHAIFQSMINKKNPNIPQSTCAPSQFADDNFLLRQMDGSIEIYPIKDVIVKECACL